uniref:C2H2-type domain-containing protein n=1 Tax=Trichogramma kaykai TaxID=54128 RepID=A0ABD2WR22_9HYME
MNLRGIGKELISTKYVYVREKNQGKVRTIVAKIAQLHTCDECDLEFTSPTRLAWHRSTHDPLNTRKKSEKRPRKTTGSELRCSSETTRQVTTYICPSCPFTTIVRSDMIKHFTKSHCYSDKTSLDSEENVKQDVEEDEMDFEAEVLEDEILSDDKVAITITELKCTKCDFTSENQADLDFHTCRAKDSNKDSNKFLCHLCTYEGLTRMGLQSHITRKHKPKPGTGVPKSYCCDECDYRCGSKNALYSHKRKHRRGAIKMNAPAEQEPGDRFYCHECDYAANTKQGLSQHITKKHRADESGGAAGGGGRAAAGGASSAAAAGSSTEKPVYNCEHCSYVNKNKYEMKVHVIRKHSNEYNYSCEICGKKYKIKGDLTNHTRFTHLEQPVICDVCGKVCQNSNALYVHQKFAHYKAEFECPTCHRRMVSQANLDDHILKQHEQREDVVCEECGKQFTRASRLKIHMRIHTGLKPFSCKVCGKAFVRKTALRQHLLIHTGQRPYVCDICGKSFTQKPGLLSHRKSHPGTHPPLPRISINNVLSDLLADDGFE